MAETNDPQDPLSPGTPPDPYGVDPENSSSSAGGSPGAGDPAAALRDELPIDGEINDLIDDSLTDDDFEAFVADDPIAGFEEVLGRPVPPPPPPSASAAPAQRRLVRDPYATLGGVSSGLAHYLGFDVTLVRLAVLIGSLSTGIGFLVYLAAWVLIPRAEYWPPAGPASSGAASGRSPISGRNLGLAVLVIGVLLIFGFSGGVGQFVVPFMLVGGGIWLLRQSSQVPATVGAGVGAAPHVGGMPAPPTSASGPSAHEPASPGYGTPMPVGKRSRKRRLMRGLIFASPLILIPIIGLAVVAPVVIDDDDRTNGFSFRAGESSYRPLTAAQLESFYEVDAGTIDLDLSALDSSMFTDLDEPFEVNMQVDFGEITVTVPEDLQVSIEAKADLGDVTVFGANDDGPGAGVEATIDNPDVVLELDVDLGEIDVRRVSAS